MLSFSVQNEKSKSRHFIGFLCLCHLISLNTSLAQPLTNALINLDFAIINHRSFKASLWDTAQTASFSYLDSNQNLVTINTMDTLINYTIYRLEKHFDIDIEPVESASNSLNFYGRYNGYPKMSLQEARDLNKYNYMFDITFIIYTYNKNTATAPFAPVSAQFNPNARVTLKLKHYNNSGKKLKQFEYKADLPGLLDYQTKSSDAKAFTGNRLFDIYTNALEEALFVGEE